MELKLRKWMLKDASSYLDWREKQIGENKKLYIIKLKGYLKLIPKRRIDLTQSLDKVDLGIEAIGNWRQFEKKFYKDSK
jgi:hypothetical protein